MPRQIQFEISNLIRRGCVVMTHKTKLAHEGGRQLVSVGPYRTAETFTIPERPTLASKRPWESSSVRLCRRLQEIDPL